MDDEPNYSKGLEHTQQRMPYRISMIRDGKWFCDVCEQFIEDVREHDCPGMAEWYKQNPPDGAIPE